MRDLQGPNKFSKVLFSVRMCIKMGAKPRSRQYKTFAALKELNILPIGILTCFYSFYTHLGLEISELEILLACCFMIDFAVRMPKQNLINVLFS
jgi:hypothetical protein